MGHLWRFLNRFYEIGYDFGYGIPLLDSLSIFSILDRQLSFRNMQMFWSFELTSLCLTIYFLSFRLSGFIPTDGPSDGPYIDIARLR